MAEGQYEQALKRAQKLMNVLDKYTVIQLTNKINFMAAVHSAIGSAYLALNDYDNAEKHHQQDLMMGEEQ